MNSWQYSWNLCWKTVLKYSKHPKNSDTRKIVVNILKFEKMWFSRRIRHLKHAYGVAYSVYIDADLGLHCLPRPVGQKIHIWQNQQNDCVPSEDSDCCQSFVVSMKKAWVLSYPLSAQWRLWSDWADAKADLSLRWAHCHFVIPRFHVVLPSVTLWFFPYILKMQRWIFINFCRHIDINKMYIHKKE